MPQPSHSEKILNCPSCGVPRNFGTTCNYCGSVYADAVKKLHPDQDLPKLNRKYTVRPEKNGVSISVPLRKTGQGGFVFVVAVFAIFGSLMFFIMTAWSAPGTVFGTVVLPLFSSIPLAFGLVCWLNRVTIKADKRYLALRYHPIPLLRRFEVRTEDMADLQVIARRVDFKTEHLDVPVLVVSTITGEQMDVLVGSVYADFGDFDVLHRLLSKALDY